MITAENYAERLFTATLGAYESLSVYAGLRLGWFAALAQDGPSTSAELADRTGTQERYCREFCELQAGLGTLTVKSGSTTKDRVYALPAGPAEVLLDEQSLNHLGPLTRLVAAAGRQIDPLLDAYRNGGGVSWAELGNDARESQAALNRPWFTRRLGPALAEVADLHAELGRPGIRIADVGCGGGWSSLALARAYPEATVIGLDVDKPSIEAARSAAEADGLADRVVFVAANGATLAERAVRCRLRLRVPARHAAAGGGADGDPASGPTGRPGGDHGRGGGRRVHRAGQRSRPVHVCLQPVHLPSRRPVVLAVGGHRHRAAQASAGRLCPPGRLRRGHRAADQ